MAFPQPLAVRLSGATPAQVRYWRTQGLLVPEAENENPPFLYSFRDVVALRTFAWLRGDFSLQLIRQTLYNAQILDVVDHPSEYVFVKIGRSIGLETTAGVVDVARHPGQQVIGTMQDVLEAFVTRQGRRQRPLASPHESIEVDVQRLGGWPTIEGTRVPYDAIAQLLEDGTVLPEDVPRYYPTVSAAAARDAAEFSRQVAGPSVAAA